MIGDARLQGPLVVVDAGNALLSGKVGPGEAGWDQAVVKAEIVAEGLAAGGLDAMALGAHDWPLGMDKVLALRQAYGLPILAANLVCDGVRPFPGAKLVQAGAHTVGVVGLTAGEVPGCEVLPPDGAAGALAEVAGADVVVVLSPVDRAALERWLADGVGADLVIDGAGSRKLEHPEALDGAWWLHTGPRGQLLGLSQLTWTAGATGWVPATEVERLEQDIARYEERRVATLERREGASVEELARIEERSGWYEEKIVAARAEQAAAADVVGHRFGYQLVQLDAQVADHAATAAVVARGKGLVEVVEPGPSPQSLAHRRVASGSPFAGSDTCQACHPAQQAQWESTAHASAWERLGEHHRSLDRQCLACHVTGWEAEGGPAAPAEIGPFRGVQCEACHGPGAAHVAAPAVATPLRDPPQEACVACHDGVQDRGRFHWDSYRPQVAH